jgi:hypothetical protein
VWTRDRDQTLPLDILLISSLHLASLISGGRNYPEIHKVKRFVLVLLFLGGSGAGLYIKTDFELRSYSITLSG